MSDALTTDPELVVEEVFVWKLTKQVSWGLWCCVRGVLRFLFAVLLVRGALFGFLGTLVFVGWCQRWMRRRVIRKWWRSGGYRAHAVDTLTAEQNPRAWPNWILPENRRRVWNSQRALPKRLFYTVFHSLWLNFREGAQAYLCTALILLPTGLLWTFGWYSGWDNSFNKGYEQFSVGQSLWWTGTLLFVLAMLHLPLAQAHQAVTGRWNAIFEFRTVRIIARQQQRTRIYLAMAYAVGSFPITGLLSWPTFLPMANPALETATDAEVMQYFGNYLLFVSALAIPIYFLLRMLAARVYARSVELGIVRGEVGPRQLGERVFKTASVLLDVTEQEREPKPLMIRGLLGSLRSAAGVTTRFLAALLWITLAFQVVIFTFFNNHGARGHMIQPMVHAPYMDYIPSHLKD